MKRTVIPHEPFVNEDAFRYGCAWAPQGCWPVSWIDHPRRPLDGPSVALFRLSFELEAETPLRLHASADNRYRLFLDGRPIGRGPERGDPGHWCFESYEGVLQPGRHWLHVQSWWLGEFAPMAQLTVRPGVMLGCEGPMGEAISTGHSEWETAICPGVTRTPAGDAWGRGSNVEIAGQDFPWDWMQPDSPLDWTPAKEIAPVVSSRWDNGTPPTWKVTPAMLPAMRDEPVPAGTLRHLAGCEKPYNARLNASPACRGNKPSAAVDASSKENLVCTSV